MAEALDLGKNVAGAPIGVWALGGAAAVGVGWFIFRRKSASTATNNAASSQPATIYQPATSGDFSTDQAEAIYSDIRNLQGQETNFAGTASQLNQGIAGVSGQVTGVSNQVSGVSQQVSNIPAGPIGPQGPAGTPGTPAPTPAPGPPRPQPTTHVAQERTDGRHSLQYYASEYGTSMANILAATAKSEPSDYNRASSALHKYVVAGRWANVVPAGFTLYIPYVR